MPNKRGPFSVAVEGQHRARADTMPERHSALSRGSEIPLPLPDQGVTLPVRYDQN